MRSRRRGLNPCLPRNCPNVHWPAHGIRQTARETQRARPANPTETQLVHELANLAWRQNCVRILKASSFDEPASRQQLVQAFSTLGVHSQRLSRQFQKTLEQLRVLQTERHEREQRDLKFAAGILEYRKHKGIDWDPAEDGFVFFKGANRAARPSADPSGDFRHVAHYRFDAPVRSSSPGKSDPPIRHRQWKQELRDT